MGAFTGQLHANEIFAALYNMIISQEVFADNIKGTNSTLVDMARVDGSLYGDTKLYYSTDVLESHAWGNDSEAVNLLALDRPQAPEVQSITLNVFRQIRLTVDNYLSKRTWGTEGAFSSFNSVMLGWIRETKKVYDSTIYNVYIGTAEGNATRSTIEVPLSDITATGEEKNRLEAQTIAQYIADLFTDMTDVTRDFNDYGQLRSYTMDEITVVWNSKFVNKINTLDLPTIFHKQGLIGKFEDKVLPTRYFGEVGSTSVAKASNDGTKRSTVEADYTTATSVGAMTAQNTTHVFPGDKIPAGTVKFDEVNNSLKNGIPANEYYTADEDVICKIMTKLPPYMSAFEVATSFFNPRSLTENHYLTYGHNTLEYLKAFPFITVHAD